MCRFELGIRVDLIPDPTTRFLIVRGMICLTIVSSAFVAIKDVCSKKKKQICEDGDRRRKSCAKNSSFRWSGTQRTEKSGREWKRDRETRILRSVLVLILCLFKPIPTVTTHFDLEATSALAAFSILTVSVYSMCTGSHFTVSPFEI